MLVSVGLSNMEKNKYQDNYDHNMSYYIKKINIRC